MLSNINNSLNVKVLTEDKISDINEAALTILHEIGVAVFHEEALNLLDGAGGSVNIGI